MILTLATAAAIVVQLLGCESPRKMTSQGGPRSPEPPQTIYESSVGVVIGVERYPHMRDAQFAEADANAVADVLTKRGFDVKRFVGSDAAKAAVSALLADDLRVSLRPNDRVLIYFAGHGVSIGEPGRETGVLMLHDSRPDKALSTGIAMTEMQRWFNTYHAKHVMFVADACYSGLALATRSTPKPASTPGYLTRVLATPVRFTLVAGAANQEARGRHGQGVFTRYFLSGLKGEADTTPEDGVVTGTELYAYVRAAVMNDVWENDGAEQTPQMASSGAGEFAFLPDAQPPPGQAAARARCKPGMVAVGATCAPAAEPGSQALDASAITLERASLFASVRDARKETQSIRSIGEMTSEIANLERAIRGSAEGSPSWAELTHRLGDAHAGLAAAIRASRQGTDASEDEIQAHRVAAKCYSDVLVKSPKYARSDEILYYAAYEDEQVGEKRAARSTYLQIIDSHPKSPLVALTYVAFAELFTLELPSFENKWELAEAAYREALKRTPENGPVRAYALYKLAHVFWVQGTYPGAFIRMIEVLSNVNGESKTKYERDLAAAAQQTLISMYVAKGNAKKAYASLSNLDNEMLTTILGTIAIRYSELGRTDEAIQVFQSVTDPEMDLCRWLTAREVPQAVREAACHKSAAAMYTRDKAANRKIDEAISLRYAQTEPVEALKDLLGTIHVCGSLCRPATLARAWMYVGVIRGGAWDDFAGARDAFRKAVGFDRNVKIDAGFTTPMTLKVFEEVLAEPSAMDFTGK